MYLNGDGEMVHLAVGSLSPDALIESGKTALNPELNLNSILTEWKSGNRDEEFVNLYFEELKMNYRSQDAYKALELRISGINDTQEGKQVPNIKTNATLDGKEFDIASLKGKYVLLDFWGTWCGPCVQEMPRLKEFQEKHKDKLVILGINSGDTIEKAKKFLDENGYAWQQLFSSKESNDDNFVNRFNVQGFPTKLIIDPEGKIVKRYLGSGDDAFTLMETLFNAD